MTDPESRDKILDFDWLKRTKEIYFDCRLEALGLRNLRLELGDVLEVKVTVEPEFR